MRKAVTNADSNWLTRVQAMEMAFDAQLQQGRLSGGGVAELRGNGELLRRDLLEACGGFNEDTVTDDLDLSFRLLLENARVGILGIRRFWRKPLNRCRRSGSSGNAGQRVVFSVFWIICRGCSPLA